MNTPIHIINAARALAGLKPIRLSYGTTQFVKVERLYHNIRMTALCVLKPKFAIKTKEEDERPLDMLRDLGDGRYVSNHEIVWEWSDDFKNKMVELLSKVSYLMG